MGTALCWKTLSKPLLAPVQGGRGGVDGIALLKWGFWGTYLLWPHGGGTRWVWWLSPPLEGWGGVLGGSSTIRDLGQEQKKI